MTPQENLLKNPSSRMCLQLRGGQIHMDHCNAADLNQHWSFSWPPSLPIGWPLAPCVPFLRLRPEEPTQHRYRSISCCWVWGFWPLWVNSKRWRTKQRQFYLLKTLGSAQTCFKLIYDENVGKTFDGGWGLSDRAWTLHSGVAACLWVTGCQLH